MTSHNARAFNEWLRTQLKAKKMSQRQLAQQSGVDHSTISRLIRGDRMPSLGTATRLARGLREIREDGDATQYLGLVANGSQNPTARVEYALRADDAVAESQVRQIMEYYLAVRMRRFGRAFEAPHRDDPVASRPAGSNGLVPLGAVAAPSSDTQAPRALTPDSSTRPVGSGSSMSLGPPVAVASRVAITQTLERPGGRNSTNRA